MYESLPMLPVNTWQISDLARRQSELLQNDNSSVFLSRSTKAAFVRRIRNASPAATGCRFLLLCMIFTSPVCGKTMKAKGMAQNTETGVGFTSRRHVGNVQWGELWGNPDESRELNDDGVNKVAISSGTASVTNNQPGPPVAAPVGAVNLYALPSASPASLAEGSGSSVVSATQWPMGPSAPPSLSPRPLVMWPPKQHLNPGGNQSLAISNGTASVTNNQPGPPVAAPVGAVNLYGLPSASPVSPAEDSGSSEVSVTQLPMVPSAPPSLSPRPSVMWPPKQHPNPGGNQSPMGAVCRFTPTNGRSITVNLSIAVLLDTPANMQLMPNAIGDLDFNQSIIMALQSAIENVSRNVSIKVFKCCEDYKMSSGNYNDTGQWSWSLVQHGGHETVLPLVLSFDFMTQTVHWIAATVEYIVVPRIPSAPQSPVNATEARQELWKTISRKVRRGKMLPMLQQYDQRIVGVCIMGNELNATLIEMGGQRLFQSSPPNDSLPPNDSSGWSTRQTVGAVLFGLTFIGTTTLCLLAKSRRKRVARERVEWSVTMGDENGVKEMLRRSNGLVLI